MRRALATSLEKLASDNEEIIFLTGDLGFNALEGLQKLMGERFINCGVAEQNMIGMAAGLALEGYSVFCYSIAPFTTLRPLEQIRNDVCLHKLPVHIIGNGGGYGYGIMGSSHHALEDIALMRVMPDMTTYVPAFSEDVDIMLKEIIQRKKPSYLRLGLGKDEPGKADNSEDIVRINKALEPKITVVACGPVVNNIIDHADYKYWSGYIDLFVVKRFPVTKTTTFLESLSQTGKLLSFEEHYQQGGMVEMLAHMALSKGIVLKKMISRCAVGYPSSTYGSQKFHQKESGLDGDALMQCLKDL